MKLPRHRAASRSIAAPCAAALCALAALACVGLDASTGPPAETHGSVFTAPSETEAVSPVLYARDGTVVVPAEGAPLAAAAVPQEHAAPARRELGSHDGGRMYLLELYQQVIDERDGLVQEVASLNADLQQARAALSESQSRAAALEQRAQELEARTQALEAESLELAGRLTTAQIRRLQAEKLLLESRIAERRAAAPSEPEPPAEKP